MVTEQYCCSGYKLPDSVQVLPVWERKPSLLAYSQLSSRKCLQLQELRFGKDLLSHVVSPENLASCYKVSLLQELMAKWERQMYKERTWLQVGSCWLEADAGVMWHDNENKEQKATVYTEDLLTCVKEFLKIVIILPVVLFLISWVWTWGNYILRLVTMTVFRVERKSQLYYIAVPNLWLSVQKLTT